MGGGGGCHGGIRSQIPQTKDLLASVCVGDFTNEFGNLRCDLPLRKILSKRYKRLLQFVIYRFNRKR